MLLSYSYNTLYILLSYIVSYCGVLTSLNALSVYISTDTTTISATTISTTTSRVYKYLSAASIGIITTTTTTTANYYYYYYY